jgi:hypothetical protein
MAATLGEFDDVEIARANVPDMAAPFFAGEWNDRAALLAETVRGAAGVVFVAQASAIGLSSCCTAALEHLLFAGDVLSGKYAMILVASEAGGERIAAETLGRFLESSGAYEAARVAIGASGLVLPEKNFSGIIERHTEDFYRVIRQRREYFISRGLIPSPPRRPAAPNLSEIAEKYGLTLLDSAAQAEFERLSERFESIAGQGFPEPAVLSCLEETLALGRTLKPIPGITDNITVQLSVGDPGEDGFEAYIKVEESARATVAEGRAERNDLTVLADEEAWRDVMSGRITAQRAFMTGRVKVRGNFAVIAKLDSLLANRV